MTLTWRERLHNLAMTPYMLLILILVWPLMLGALQAFISGGTPPNASVGTAALKTSTGSATTNCTTAAVIQINGNDYSFAPHLFGGVALCAGMSLASKDNESSGTTNLTLKITTTSNLASPFGAEWRYITASDNPTIWVVYDALGVIQATWSSDDPCEPSDAIPCVSVSPCVGCTTKKFKSSDFDNYTFPAQVVQDARDWITQRNYKMSNLSYRALQKYAAPTKAPSDYAPSNWIQVNLKLVGGVPVLKSTGLTVLP